MLNHSVLPVAWDSNLRKNEFLFPCRHFAGMRVDSIVAGPPPSVCVFALVHSMCIYMCACKTAMRSSLSAFLSGAWARGLQSERVRSCTAARAVESAGGRERVSATEPATDVCLYIRTYHACLHRFTCRIIVCLHHYNNIPVNQSSCFHRCLS